jgi:hypothetical protein
MARSDLAKLVGRCKVGRPWCTHVGDKEFRREGRIARLECAERVMVRKWLKAMKNGAFLWREGEKGT